jgi:hypothetical protein
MDAFVASGTPLTSRLRFENPAALPIGHVASLAEEGHPSVPLEKEFNFKVP